MASRKRFEPRLLFATAAFLAGSYLSKVWLHHVDQVSLRILAALSPLLPACWVMYVVVQRIRSLDELQRRIELEAATIAGLLVGIVSFAAGFLEEAHLLQVSIITVFPTMLAAYALAQSWVAWRYR